MSDNMNKQVAVGNAIYKASLFWTSIGGMIGSICAMKIFTMRLRLSAPKLTTI